MYFSSLNKTRKEKEYKEAEDQEQLWNEYGSALLVVAISGTNTRFRA